LSRPLEFGIWDHFERLPDQPLWKQYDDRIELVQRAEQLGFSRYHVAEHHNTPLDLTPSPIVLLAAMARETSSIRLGSMVLILPLYHPVRLIEEICMLDQLSHGRFEPGVGRGVRDVEHEWFGVDIHSTRERFNETYEIVLEGLRQRSVAHRGPLYELPSMPVDLSSYQQPVPPFWYAGNFGFAARHGMNALGGPIEEGTLDGFWAEWQQQRDAGNPLYQREPLAGINRHLYVAENDELAQKVAQRAWLRYGDNFWTTEVRLEGTSYARPLGALGGPSITAAMDEGLAVVGSPETVTSQLGDLLEGFGPKINYLVTNFAWGDLTHEEALGSMELFASEVMPSLRQRHPASD
jgi:alkanesulfonate monooxygenase SsuD/methylene tetrahydromethanopterin reductase-like flavin-dependent oxidoreductase (luciferase family)